MQMSTEGTWLRNSCVQKTSSIMDGLRAIEDGGLQIAFAISESERLEGVVTDGNLRRAILQGASLDSPLLPHMARTFVSVGVECSRTVALEIMKSRGIRHLPVLDDAGKIIGIHLLTELLGGPRRNSCAVIMAGGRGTRLWPLTENIPKPMLMVAGRPILERLVLHLTGFGIRKIFLAVHYLAEQIEEHFGLGRSFGCEIHYLKEERPMGTGGALSLLPKDLNQPLLILNGDIVTQANIGALLDFHQSSGNDLTLGTHLYQHQIPFGCVRVDGNRIAAIQEKPIICRQINSGIYVLNPPLLNYIPLNCDYPMTDLIQSSIDRGEKVCAFEIHDDWIDVGQKEQLEIATKGTTQ